MNGKSKQIKEESNKLERGLEIASDQYIRDNKRRHFWLIKSSNGRNNSIGHKSSKDWILKNFASF